MDRAPFEYPIEDLLFPLLEGSELFVILNELLFNLLDHLWDLFVDPVAIYESVQVCEQIDFQHEFQTFLTSK